MGLCYVYVIVSQRRRYTDVGLTLDRAKRLAEHNEGKSRATAPYRPFDVLMVEEFPSRMQAREREKFLKTGKGREITELHRKEKYAPAAYPCDGRGSEDAYEDRVLRNG